MYRDHVSLISGLTGQTLEFYPPFHEVLVNGAPTSAATYRVLRGTNPDTATVEFSGTATLDSVSTTLVDDTGYSQTDRTLIVLTSYSNLAIGRRYLLTNTDTGQREPVQLAKIDTGDGAYADSPLSFDYPPGSTFIGLRQSFTVDATFIADTNKINIAGVYPGLSDPHSSTALPPYRIEWSYSTGGITRKTWTSFDVVRKPLKHSVSIQDLKRIVPDVVWREWTQQRGQHYEPQIDEAFELVRYDIRMAGYDPDQVIDTEVINMLVRYRAIVVIGLGAKQGEISEWLRYQIEDYQKKFQSAIGTGLRAWIDTGADGSVAVDPPRQLWLRGR